VAFVLIHVFEVLISGVFNQLRGMITGYYKVDTDGADPGGTDAAKPDETISAEECSHD